jgi:hypothetical protein
MFPSSEIARRKVRSGWNNSSTDQQRNHTRLCPLFLAREVACYFLIIKSWWYRARKEKRGKIRNRDEHHTALHPSLLFYQVEHLSDPCLAHCGDSSGSTGLPLRYDTFRVGRRRRFEKQLMLSGYSHVSSPPHVYVGLCFMLIVWQLHHHRWRWGWRDLVSIPPCDGS